jgi:hypothetical protein
MDVLRLTHAAGWFPFATECEYVLKICEPSYSWLTCSVGWGLTLLGLFSNDGRSLPFRVFASAGLGERGSTGDFAQLCVCVCVCVCSQRMHRRPSALRWLGGWIEGSRTVSFKLPLIEWKRPEDLEGLAGLVGLDGLDMSRTGDQGGREDSWRCGMGE